MLEAFQVLKNAPASVASEVVLTFDERQKSRYKTVTANGADLGWFIERGTVLIDGDILQCQSGELVRVVSAPESVSQVLSNDQLLLTRVAYHLGNRHVPLQIGPNFLRYLHDHVLDDMVRGLGAEVSFEQQPFQPENGAYHGKHQSHHHHEH